MGRVWCLGGGVPTELCCPCCVPRLSQSCGFCPAVSHLKTGHVAASVRPTNNQILGVGGSDLVQRLCLCSHSKHWCGPGWLCQVPISREGPTGSRGGCSGLSCVMWPFPGPGQPMPKPGEDYGPWRSQGQLEGLKGTWNIFRVSGDPVTLRAPHQGAGTRMGGEPSPSMCSVQAFPCSWVGSGGAEHWKVFGMQESRLLCCP